MEFIMKDQLKEDYIAIGRFYILEYPNMKACECRSILEIFTLFNYYNLKGTNKIDAVFVMMNPGSGKPKEDYKQKTVSVKELNNGMLDEIQLVEAEPDETQYQVMRVMKEMKWNYVRVINLSDFKKAKSKDFYDLIKKAKIYDTDFIHSIFSSKRTTDLNNILKSDNDFKIFVAWGVNTKLHSLIELALANKSIEKRIGNNKATFKSETKNNFYYYHPLQRGHSKQSKWLEDIIGRI